MVDEAHLLRNLAELENNLYDKVDAEIVVKILRNHLDDFLHYRNAILAFLKRIDED